MKIHSLTTIVAAAILAMTGNTYAADQDQTRTQDKDQTKTQDRDKVTQQDRQIYGYQLMTAKERAEYRERMRKAKTAEEREQLRKEHHERMKARAKERGMKLPDEPPARGMGPGGGTGPRDGTGPGGGMGPGGGRR